MTNEEYIFTSYFKLSNDSENISFLPEYFETHYPFIITKPKVHYEISLTSPPKAAFGEAFPFSFSIIRKAASSPEEVSFNINCYNQWLIIGQSQSQIRLELLKPQLIHLQLVPTATGWLQLPRIVLKGVSINFFLYFDFLN